MGAITRPYWFLRCLKSRTKVPATQQLIRSTCSSSGLCESFVSRVLRRASAWSFSTRCHLWALFPSPPWWIACACASCTAVCRQSPFHGGSRPSDILSCCPGSTPHSRKATFDICPFFWCSPYSACHLLAFRAGPHRNRPQLPRPANAPQRWHPDAACWNSAFISLLLDTSQVRPLHALDLHSLLEALRLWRRRLHLKDEQPRHLLHPSRCSSFS